MRDLEVPPTEFTGNGAWLTPRLKAFTKGVVEHSALLASDVFTVGWEGGEPAREVRITKLKARQVQAEQTEKAVAIAPAKTEEKESGTSSSSDSAGSSSRQSLMNRRGKGAGRGRGRRKPRGHSHTQDEAEEDLGRLDPMKTRDWIRALGFQRHDEDDFDRAWREPLTQVRGRSFSEPGVVELPAVNLLRSVRTGTSWHGSQQKFMTTAFHCV